MSEVERGLLRELIELDNAVRAMASANPKPDLVAIFGRLERLESQLPGNTDPTLLHYLRKKSYEKARLWLQGRDSLNQVEACGHVE